MDELKHRVAARMGDVVGKRVVDAQPIEMQDRSGRPDGRTQQLTQQAPTAEARKRVVHELARDFGRELDGLDLLRPLATADHPLARRPEVANPTHLAERCLDEPPITEFPQGDWRLVRPSGDPATNDEQDVRLRRQAATQREAHQRADRVEDRCAYALPDLGRLRPMARTGRVHDRRPP